MECWSDGVITKRQINPASTPLLHRSITPFLEAQSLGQANRIKRRMDLCVVVEIDEHRPSFGVRFGFSNKLGIRRLTAAAPVFNSYRPPFESAFGISAYVKLLRPVQPD